MAATRDGLLAIGTDGSYRIDASGTGTRQTWPPFTEVDGVLVSFALPDVVLVMSGGDGHRARNGALIAAR